MENNNNNTFEEKLIDVADVILIIMVGAALLTTAFIFLVRGNAASPVAQKAKMGTSTQDVSNPDQKPNPYQALSLQAQAVYVYDIAANEVLFEKNSKTPLPLASLTKIMTALVALDTLPPSAEIAIDTESIKEEGDTGLIAGEKWTLKNLLDFTLVVSSNDGAQALAANALSFGSAGSQIEGDRAATFLDKMNTKARTIGLATLHFNNTTGLDLPDGSPGGRGSAEDVAKLVQFAVAQAPQAFEATRHPALSIPSESTTHYITNTNSILGSIPGILASKTGFSDLAGGNLAIAYDSGLQEPVIIVVLGSTYDGRFEDVKSLIAATRQYISE